MSSRMPLSDDSDEGSVVEIIGEGERTKRKRKHKNKKHNSCRYSDVSNTNTSSSEDETHRQKKDKREHKDAKKITKHKKPKKSKSDHKHKKTKTEKNNKKSKSKNNNDRDTEFGAVGNKWGKYGILHDTDMWNKRPEFTLWLLEVKNKNIEELSNWEEKRLFSDFVEDYNTATLPHKKFYNLELWEAEERMRQAQESRVTKEKTDFNDEAQRMREIRTLREQRRQLATAQELQLLRQDREKVLEMREQRLMASKVETLYKLGRNAEAEALAERLKPDT